MTRDTPIEVKTALISAAGTNPYGEPKFRVIWGGNATDRLGYRYAHLPNGNESWHLERWVPAEFYGSPDKWNEAENGPFPSRGGYEHSVAFGPYVTAALAEYFARAIIYGIERFDSGQRMAALKRREELAQKAWDESLNEVLETTKQEMDAVPIEPSTGKGGYGVPTAGFAE